MLVTKFWYIIFLATAFAGLVWAVRNKTKARPIPEAIRPDYTLPDFSAIDEDGATLGSSSLRGSPTVLLFVRGS
jgi:cytochrome oxidase Cu insertion factor (SCO1/SenC/PrrC family)